LILGFLHHRGPTHSLITIIVLTVPFLLLYRKIAIPYFIALASHSLIGDFFTGGTQLFWPLSTQWYGALNIDVNSFTNAFLEMILFVISTAVMLKTGDLRKIVQDKYKIALLLPFGATLGPLLSAGRGSEQSLPLLLIIPSLFYLAIFVYSMLAGQFRKK